MGLSMGNNYLPTEYQTFIHASRYARWLPDDSRRETWASGFFSLKCC